VVTGRWGPLVPFAFFVVHVFRGDSCGVCGGFPRGLLLSFLFLGGSTGRVARGGGARLLDGGEGAERPGWEWVVPWGRVGVGEWVRV